jgi:hypothetical protein
LKSLGLDLAFLDFFYDKWGKSEDIVAETTGKVRSDDKLFLYRNFPDTIGGIVVII